MDTHLLVAVADDRSWSACLHFLHVLFPELCAVTVTFFRVDSNQYAWPAGLEPFEAAAVVGASSHPQVEAARDWMRGMGCPADRAMAKVAAMRHGTARDIAEEARKGLYDAVVMGRRDLSWLESLVAESVSDKLLAEPLDFPVWICRQSADETPRRGILLCLDGSPASLRMADHVGFMLSPQREGGAGAMHPVTLLQARPKGADPAGAEAVFAAAEAALAANSVPAERITRKLIEDGDAARAILAEAGAGGYAAVAVGRRHAEPGGKPGRGVTGSVSSAVLRELTGVALWVGK